MADYEFKKGTDFEIVNTYTESLVPVDLTNYTIESDIDDSSGALLVAFTVTKTNPISGVYSLSLTDTQTASYATGTYNFDIKFTDDAGLVFKTRTYTLSVVEDITE